MPPLLAATATSSRLSLFLSSPPLPLRCHYHLAVHLLFFFLSSPLQFSSPPHLSLSPPLCPSSAVVQGKFIPHFKSCI
ncbi:hypothetical protein ACOSQ4_006881 [Xanthoceras sorbifolium]